MPLPYEKVFEGYQPPLQGNQVDVWIWGYRDDGLGVARKTVGLEALSGTGLQGWDKAVRRYIRSKGGSRGVSTPGVGPWRQGRHPDHQVYSKLTAARYGYLQQKQGYVYLQEKKSVTFAGKVAIKRC